ncbi:response regulator transcription factor [Agriterribacter sp.]|uniref:response regulator transcription factor n=1 Tax=Agriterribacter sp. TaxID=2821509 RepID=UPI002B743C53|nr:response regulator transcription factor [Agriterribacter sp.]HTN06156.1 response regulator transcription factor [Agriterribacter sp.]
MPSILIAEDHSVVRMGIIFLVKELYADAEIIEAETFDEVIQVLNNRHFDLLLLDIHIPGGDNLQMVEAVKLRQPATAVLIVSSYDEQLYALRYIRAGAHGYLQKNTSPEEIKKAIKKVLNNEKYIGQLIREQLVMQKLDPASKQSETDTLSNRETEIMQFLVRGSSTSEIKEALNIQDSTVSTYKAKIFEKMQVSNVVELAEKLRLLNYHV